MARIFRTHEALRAKFPSPEYALFFEVHSRTGGGSRRSADAVAMSLWPSRGLEMIGFEFKSSRDDWLREKKNPDKAESVYRYCDRWYLVVSDADIVKREEIPPTWGLLAPHGESDRALKLVVEAPKLEPQALDRRFVAALLRRADESVEQAKRRLLTEEEKTELVADAVEQEIGRRTVDVESRAKQAERDRDALRNAITNFEKASGILLDGWTAGQVGEIVRELLALDRDQLRRRFEMIAGASEDIARNARSALAAIGGKPPR